MGMGNSFETITVLQYRLKEAQEELAAFRQPQHVSNGRAAAIAVDQPQAVRAVSGAAQGRIHRDLGLIGIHAVQVQLHHTSGHDNTSSQLP